MYARHQFSMINRQFEIISYFFFFEPCFQCCCCCYLSYGLFTWNNLIFDWCRMLSCWLLCVHIFSFEMKIYCVWILRAHPFNAYTNDPSTIRFIFYAIFSSSSSSRHSVEVFQCSIQKLYVYLYANNIQFKVDVLLLFNHFKDKYNTFSLNSKQNNFIIMRNRMKKINLNFIFIFIFIFTFRSFAFEI